MKFKHIKKRIAKYIKNSWLASNKYAVKLINVFYEKGTNLGVRCSGHKVYPNGKKCYGCSDCQWTKDDVIECLWDIIDDIDTASDIAKNDNKLYRSLVDQYQKKRWKTPVILDKEGNINLSQIK
jgi:hypothetical protein